MIVSIVIRKWKIEDKKELAENLNNVKILNNLRDGIPYPYSEKNAEEFIRGTCTLEITIHFP